MRDRAVPLSLLALSLAGIAWFSQRLEIVDTVALLACGAVAGGSLAALARGRIR
jgi:hypothetical protein